MSLKSNFNNKRDYYFWATFLCYLITLDSRASNTDRKLFGTLAYRMISKAAEDVPTDPVCKIFFQPLSLYPLPCSTWTTIHFALGLQMPINLCRKNC